MPHRSIELSLVAPETQPLRHEGREPCGRAAGPGWFDSSWDLRRGLEVREGWSDEERVHGWIEDFLRAQRAIDRVTSSSPTIAMT
jgi:hypothetical protein